MKPLRKPVRILRAHRGPSEWYVYDPGTMPEVMTPEIVEFHVGDMIHGVLRGTHETEDAIWLSIEKVDPGAA